jgi:hypothetical protein
MKGVRSILFSLTVGFAVLAPPWTYLGSRHIGAAYAQVSVTGTLVSVGTLEPLGGNATGSQVRARVRIDKGDCNGSTITEDKPLFIIINSGVLDATSLAERNSLNMKNAYSTLLTAPTLGQDGPDLWVSELQSERRR